MEHLAFLQNLIKTFNWHNPSWDLFILLFWVVASVLYAFAAGRGRILTVLVSIFMSQLLVIKATFLTELLANKVHIGEPSLQQLAVFSAFFIVLFMLLSRYAFKSSVDGRHVSSLGFSLIFAILQIGLLINITLTYLPNYIQSNFSPLIQFLFLHPYAGFIWLALPVLFLIILGKFVSERAEI
ncbi:MAG: hypothetical protein M3Q64_01770 [bacterium]|nr:hypothetical protein [bacterium]